MNPASEPIGVRLYRICDRVFPKLVVLQHACMAGLWLGVLDRKSLHLVGKAFYAEAATFCDPGHNRSGLMAWELEAVGRYFPTTGSVLIAAVGGGREAFALHALGYRVEAFDCNPHLVHLANALCDEAGMPFRVQCAAPDTCPPTDGPHDAAIVGWGGYAEIRGRSQRIRFLRQLRDCLRPGAPVLLSFHTRPEQARSYRLIAAIGNCLRWLGARDPVEVGDTLVPYFVHFFTRAEIEAELAAAGFVAVFRGSSPPDAAGYAVGVSR